MLRSAVAALFAVTRLDTCAIVFLSILLPLYARTGDLAASMRASLPVLTICMCGFVINDLSDKEKDAKNHPGRPLPSGAIGEAGASIVYFTLLAISLVAIKAYVAESLVYLYVLLLIALINYNYVVAYVPAAKTPYVSAVGLLPVFILASHIKAGALAIWIAPSLFLFLLGRETLMDVQDAAGDARTLAKIIGIRTAEHVAFTLKILGSAGLAFAAQSVAGAGVAVGLVLLDLVFLWGWRQRAHRRLIVHLMKLQLLAGIYFLVGQASP